jgi:hypothetical protein
LIKGDAAMSEQDEKENARLKKANAKKKLRLILYGSVAAGSVMGLAGITAQAHGNASSHGEAQLSWNFNDYVIKREDLKTTYPREIEKLEIFQEDIEQLSNSRRLFKETINFNYGALNDNEIPNLVSKLDKIDGDNIEAIQILSNQITVNSIKQSTALSPITKEVFQNIKSGNYKQAIKVIESASSAKDVLSNYSIVQLDLYNYAVVDQLSTAQLTDEIIKISRAALNYQKSKAPKELATRAGILHNLASAAQPDHGTATASQTKAGRLAAEEALKIRTSLGDKPSIAVAEYMVGVYDYKANKLENAHMHFEKSLELLTNSHRVQDIAWSTLYLGLTKLKMNDKSGNELVEKVRQTFAEEGNKMGLAHIVSASQKI